MEFKLFAAFLFLTLEISNGIRLFADRKEDEVYKQIAKMEETYIKPSFQNPFPKASYNFAIDITTYASVSSLQCIYQQGYNAVFVQVYSTANGGSVNQNGLQSVKSAYSANLGTEVYVTPATSGKSGAQQFNEAYNALKSQGFNVRTIWLQITSAINWPNSVQTNVNFIQSFVNQANVNGVTTGIYTNWGDWQQVTGNYNGFSSSPLWYYNAFGQGPSGESPANFDDFRPFGGWTSPNVKQFALNEGLCGLTLNRDVYPLNGKKLDTVVQGSIVTVGGFV